MTDHQHVAGESASSATAEIDPVCGMKVDPQNARATAEYGGKKYYFCCQGCATRFSAEPEKFLNKSQSATHSNQHGPLVHLGGAAATMVEAPSSTHSQPGV